MHKHIICFLLKYCEFPIEPKNESSSSSPLQGNEGDNAEHVFETLVNKQRVGISSDMWRDIMQNDNGYQQWWKMKFQKEFAIAL